MIRFKIANLATSGLLWLVASFFTPLAVSGQEFIPLRGERPPIDLDALSDDVWEPGRLRIRFSEDFAPANAPPGIAFRINQKGELVSGMPSLDSLNRANGVYLARPTFESRAFSGEFRERHRKWGFHLWYDIYFDDNINIRQLLDSYVRIEGISFAEPHYRKVLIGNPEPLDVSCRDVLAMPEQSPGDTLSGKESEPWFPNDPLFSSQWHYHNTGQANGTPGADISLPQAWSVSRGSDEVIVAVIDGGIRWDHADLSASMWENIGYNFFLDTTLVLGTHHGTHVGGTVGATTNNATGVSGIAGGSGDQPGVRLMSLQVFLDMGGAGFELAPVFAADNGAAISQNSWGYGAPNVYEQAVLDAIDYFNTHGGGALLRGGITFNSAGNSNSNAPFYPGVYSGCFAVAATNNKDQKAYYSNYGNYVDISAPGGEMSPQNAGAVYSTSITLSGYAFAEGTSMACPHVSGVAALMLSVAPGEYTAGELADFLRQSADNHYDQNPDFQGMLGAGRLNAWQAVIMARDNRRSVTDFHVQNIHQGRNLLGWEPNKFNEPVYIAYHTRTDQPLPEAGVMPGDTLLGGARIVYKGYGRAFSHVTPAESPLHCYSIWSYREDDQSFSRISHVCLEPDIQTYGIPFQEPFRLAALPLGWDTQLLSTGTGDQGEDPQLDVFSSHLHPQAYPSTEGYMVVFNSEQARRQARIRLISPPVSTFGMSQIELHFDWHHQAEQANVADRMSLQFSLNGEQWTNVAVVNRSGQETGWHEKTFSVPVFFNNRDEVFVGFLFEADRQEGQTGGNMYMDNVRLITRQPQIVPGFSVSSQVALAGERLLYRNSSTGALPDSYFWQFGEDAFPSSAHGPGPHEVIYRETGLKSPSLILNDSLIYTQAEMVHITANSHLAPQNLSGVITPEGNVVLDWEMQTEKTRRSAPDGFHLFLNRAYHAHIQDGSMRAFTHEQVPEGWLRYYLTAYYGSTAQESVPSQEITLSLNAIEVELEIQGEGTTYPSPGSFPWLPDEGLVLQALAGDGHVFGHWLINGLVQIDDNPLELWVEENTHILAVFESGLNVIRQQFSLNDLRLYPNPARDFICVSSENRIEVLQVYDLKGSLIAYQHTGGGYTECIELSGITPGLYTLRLTAPEGTVSRKFMIIP